MLDALRAVCVPGVTERWSGKVVDLRAADLDERDHQDLIALMEADGVANPRQQVFELLVPLIVGTHDEDGAARRAETILAWCMPANLDGIVELLRHDVSAAVVRLAGQTGDQRRAEPARGPARASLGGTAGGGRRGTGDPVRHRRRAAADGGDLGSGRRSTQGGRPGVGLLR